LFLFFFFFFFFLLIIFEKADHMVGFFMVLNIL